MPKTGESEQSRKSRAFKKAAKASTGGDEVAVSYGLGVSEKQPNAVRVQIGDSGIDEIHASGFNTEDDRRYEDYRKLTKSLGFVPQSFGEWKGSVRRTGLPPRNYKPEK